VGQLKTLVYSAPTENEATLNQGMLNASKIILQLRRDLCMIMTMIRCVRERIATKGAYFEHFCKL
jgi:hypothetical protein